MRPSTDETEAYWQGYVSLWLLTAVFPDWENRKAWLNMIIRQFSNGLRTEAVIIQRDGCTVEAAMSSVYFLMAISGKEISYL